MDDIAYLKLSGDLARYRIYSASESTRTLISALCAAASYWGLEYRPDDIARRFPGLLREEWRATLPEAAQYLQVDIRVYDDSPGSAAAAIAPTILIANGVAYLGARRRFLRKQRFISLKDGKDVQTPSGHHQLLVVTPKLQISPGASRFLTLADLAWRTPGFKHSIAVFSALTVCLELFALLAPLQLQILIDHAIPGHDYSLLYLVAFAFLASAVIQAGLQFARNQLINWLNSSIGLQWSTTIFSRLLLLPYSYYQASTAGAIVTSFASLQQILRSMTSTLVAVLFDGAVSIVMLAVMCAFSPGLAALVVAFVVLNAVLKLLWTRLVNPRRRDLLEAAAAQQSMLIDAIRGVHSLKANDLEGAYSDGYRSIASVAAAKNMALLVSSNLVAQTANLVLVLQRVFVIALSAKLVLDGAFTVGVLVAFVSYSESFSNRSSAFADKVSEIWALDPHFDRVFSLLSEEADPAYSTSYLGDAQNSHIGLSQVKFSYAEGGREVIRKTSLDLNEGDFIGISAPSGSGKSTFVKLIAGLYVPREGEIRLGGRTIHELGAHKWRSRISLTSQDDTLFPGTVAANISGFDPNEDMARVVSAARLACVSDDIAALSNGYCHEFITGAANLSTGQKQRLMIARAIYRRPEVFILDEATANLDVETEDKLLCNLALLGKSVIVISHREKALSRSTRRFTLRII